SEVWGAAATTIVGCGGEVIRADGGRWRRLGGGISVTLTAAREAGGVLWAVGGHIFRHDGSSWNLVPDAGRAELMNLPGSPAAAAAQGRGIKVHAGDRWVALPGTPAPVVAVWVAGPKDALAIADRLVRWNGKAWAPVAGVGNVYGLAGTPSGVLAWNDDAAWR